MEGSWRGTVHFSAEGPSECERLGRAGAFQTEGQRRLGPGVLRLRLDLRMLKLGVGTDAVSTHSLSTQEEAASRTVPKCCNKP